MKKETVNIILTIVALIPMTYFMVLSIYALANLLSKFDVDDTLILISITFGILGYVGLLMNLKQSKNKNVEFINLTFLSLGIIGFVLFNSIQGGTKAWKWVIMTEEPDEWLMFVGPILITMYLSIIKGKRLITKN